MVFGNFRYKKAVIKNTITNLLFCLLFLPAQQLYSQSKEENIYVAIETFTAHPTQINLAVLIAFEKKFQIKTKPEFLAIVILNCNKAYYQNLFGQAQNAISSYEKAWQIYNKNKLQNYDIIEYCLKPLGNLYTQIGDFENAENTIKNYLFIANTNNNELQKFGAVQNLAIAYYSSGKNNEAVKLLENELQLGTLNSIQKGIVLANLGSNYLALHKKLLAKTTLLKSIQLLAKDNKQYKTLANSYRNLSFIYLYENNFNRANLYFNKSKTLLLLDKTSSIRERAKLHLEEAVLLFHDNKTIEAQQNLTQLFTLLLPNYSQKNWLATAKSLYAETVLLDSFDLQAELYLSKNEKEKALKWYDLSFKIENLLQSLVVYENSQIISQINTRNRIEKCLAICENLFKKEHKIIYLQKAFQYSEQNKSVVLQNALRHNTNRSKTEVAILEAIQKQNKIITNEQQKLKLANIKIINQAINKQNQFMLDLKLATKKNDFQTEIFTLDLVYKKLNKDHAILISYFIGKEKTYCFTLENNSLKIKTFTTLKYKITNFLNYFSDSEKITTDIAGYIKAGNELYTYLKLPINKKNKNLIIIPDGLLNFVPFEALVTKKSETINFEKINYLLTDYNVAYNNSVSMYLKLNQPAINVPKVLGVFPIFENSNLELAYSKEEMNVIKSNFEGKYLQNKFATFDNFKRNAPNFSILHLSTHASSGDIDEPASLKFFDKTIVYSDLYYLHLKADLVVLSACETGLGKLYSGEGALSISRGFQIAGAKNLLFSLWKVNDYTTSIFMEKFYKNLKTGNSYFESNHKSKLDYLKDSSISNSKKSPYYWCAMVYYGGLETNKNNSFLWFFITLGFVTSLIIYFKFKK